MNNANEPSAPWYVTAFRQEYLDVYARRNEADAQRAVNFAASRLKLNNTADARDTGVAVLDLCCGAGRHAKLLHAMGVAVTGLDLSEDLLKAAHAACPELPLVRGDARHLPFRSQAFGVVLNLFSSFGYFTDEADNQRQLAEMIRVTAPMGSLLIDHMNPGFIAATLKPSSEEMREDATIRSTRRIDHEAQRVEKDVQIIRNGRTISQYTESVRMYGNDEWRAMLAANGAELLETFGDFDGSRCDPQTSPRQILLVRRVASP